MTTNIAGQRFGKLTVIKFSKIDNHHHSCWLCRCDCGNTHLVSLPNLKSGRTLSCGCQQHAKGNQKINPDRGTRLYRIWQGMLNRCRNPNTQAYKYYGGRGITVCDDWRKWLNFKEWAMSNEYTDMLTIERVNV